MTRLVFLDPFALSRTEQIGALLPDGWELSVAKSRAVADQLAALSGADFAVTADVPVTAEMFAVPGLKGVHKWGVGYDNIDLDAARANGVRVMRTTGSNAVAVAETALAMMLALNRNLVRGHMGVLEGKWLKSECAQSSTRLSGKTVGIVGLGHIGTALARLLAGFGCTILYTKRTPLSAEEEQALGVTHVALDRLLRESDVVSLHCALNEGTANLIDAAALAKMKPDAILINAARGGVVVESDLAAAVREGRLRGAAVDVFATEPVEPDNPLVGLDGVIVTPHVAALTSDGFVPSITRMIANMVAVDQGREPAGIDIIV
ncbi:2-hydroxyacid dehydrogenase [Frigidibacter sp. ROC022]|uniref:2-hydroxyacid dehydrogenase n=1 Tax=Frigidibacter sp. ROC022 TaxID=2971796 RepID=UPI00215AC92C|nr:2-hydroxyacid dehydrogenase [Frigidibacter sp. ROC022]MCR8725636.1 2-hydroxyacid dehydrogenase [Frigidibacter sp. ROC022]